jgi:hypothetical protein
MKLRDEELHDVYNLSDIIRVIKSRSMRWAGHVARMGRGPVHTGFWWGKLREGDHTEDLGVDGSIILNWILKRYDLKTRTVLIWLRMRDK